MPIITTPWRSLVREHSENALVGDGNPVRTQDGRQVGTVVGRDVVNGAVENMLVSVPEPMVGLYMATFGGRFHEVRPPIPDMPDLHLPTPPANQIRVRKLRSTTNTIIFKAVAGDGDQTMHEFGATPDAAVNGLRSRYGNVRFGAVDWGDTRVPGEQSIPAAEPRVRVMERQFNNGTKGWVATCHVSGGTPSVTAETANEAVQKLYNEHPQVRRDFEVIYSPMSGGDTLNEPPPTNGPMIIATRNPHRTDFTWKARWVWGKPAMRALTSEHFGTPELAVADMKERAVADGHFPPGTEPTWEIVPWEQPAYNITMRKYTGFSGSMYSAKMDGHPATRQVGLPSQALALLREMYPRHKFGTVTEREVAIPDSAEINPAPAPPQRKVFVKAGDGTTWICCLDGHWGTSYGGPTPEEAVRNLAIAHWSRASGGVIDYNPDEFILDFENNRYDVRLSGALFEIKSHAVSWGTSNFCASTVEMAIDLVRRHRRNQQSQAVSSAGFRREFTHAELAAMTAPVLPPAPAPVKGSPRSRRIVEI